MTGGTRFRLFPAYAAGYAEPEVVEVSLPPGTIGPGPSDPWMYALHPLRKDTQYRSAGVTCRRIAARPIRRRCQARAGILTTFPWMRRSSWPRISMARYVTRLTSGSTIWGVR